jgi:cbb3-type cytochrome oxidase subunit 3
MDQAAVVLLIVNGAFAIVLGWLLAHRLRRASGAKRVLPWLFALWGVYLAECMAFAASMGTDVFSICLAAIWGLVFGHRFRAQPRREAMRLSLWLALYTCLPAISFASVLGLMVMHGWPVLTVEGGRRFGMPAFVPWPFCTCLGFFLTVIGAAVLLKTAITVGISSLLSPRAGQAGR